MLNINQQRILIFVINLVYFQVGLLVSILSALMPEIIRSYKLSYTIAAGLPFAFYIAYALVSFPTGIANQKYSARNVLLFAFSFAFSGILLFVLFPGYLLSVTSLFILGSSLAVIQVSAVPLLRNVCGAEQLAFHSTMNQLAYGIGAFVSPLLFSFINTFLSGSHVSENILLQFFHHVTPLNFRWMAIYWFFMLVILITIIIILLIRFPQRAENNAITRVLGKDYRNLLQNKTVVFFFVALMAYASCEQGVAVWMSEFLNIYHGLNPQTEGASILSWYWLLISLGCLFGMLLLKLMESRVVLGIFTIGAILSFSLSIYGDAAVAKFAFPLVGFFESVMWPIILSIAVNSVSRHHEVLTGLMYTASVGGAFGPLIIGAVSDYSNLQFAFHFIFLPLTIILAVAFLFKNT